MRKLRVLHLILRHRCCIGVTHVSDKFIDGICRVKVRKDLRCGKHSTRKCLGELPLIFAAKLSIGPIKIQTTWAFSSLITEDLTNPLAVVVDPFEERIYWTDYSFGSSYKIESADLDGKNRLKHVHEPSRRPVGLAIDADNIYFANASAKEVVQLNKKSGNMKVVARMGSHIPRGIIVRNSFQERDHVTPKCEAALKVVKDKITQEKAEIMAPISDYCLNEGKEVLEEGNRRCDCPVAFTGARCEIDLCKNYCLNGGTCVAFKNATVRCENCDLGFQGARCEIDICKKNCLNGGMCDLKDRQPVCTCPLGFYGDKCETKRPKWDIVCIEMCQEAEIEEDLKPICQR